MDETIPTEDALKLMRIKASTERFHDLSYHKRSINRSRAMKILHPLMDKLDQYTTAADFVTHVETCLTQESVKVLTQDAKRTIRLAAEVVDNKKVLEWIAAAREDRTEYTWMETIETPKPPADISRELLKDLDILVDAAPSNMQDLLRSRAQVAKLLYESFEQRIREVTVVSETNMAANQQLKKELSRIRKDKEQRPAPKGRRKVIADKKVKHDDSENEVCFSAKRRVIRRGRSQARKASVKRERATRG
ncbi:hypothetical protein ACQKWADRAFT_316091 [Trichoderma austrokoningii]